MRYRPSMNRALALERVLTRLYRFEGRFEEVRRS